MQYEPEDEERERVPSSGIYDFLWAASSRIGAGLFALSFGVIVLTFPGRHSDVVLVPALVGVFGVPFAVAFMALQYALLILMRSYKGLAFATGLFIAGVLIAYIKKYVWGSVDGRAGIGGTTRAGITLARHMLVSGACLSGIGIGAALYRDWLRTVRRRGDEGEG